MRELDPLALKKEVMSYISIYYDNKNVKEQNEIADKIIKLFHNDSDFRNKVEKIAKKMNDDNQIKKGGRKKTHKYQKGGNGDFFSYLAVAMLTVFCGAIIHYLQNIESNTGRTTTATENINVATMEEQRARDQRGTSNNNPASSSPPRGRGATLLSGESANSPGKIVGMTREGRRAREESLARRAARERGPGRVLDSTRTSTGDTPKKVRRARRAKSAERRRGKKDKKNNDGESKHDENKKKEGGGRKRHKTRKKQKRRK